MSVLNTIQGKFSLSFFTAQPVSERWRMMMRAFFLLYVLTFSLAPFFRDFFPVLCLLCLIPYYALDYKKSTLFFFDGKKYFLFFYAFLILGVLLSQNVWASFLKVSLHSFTSLALPFVAMESIRSSKELRMMAYTLVLALCGQGINGIYQYVTGHDLVHNIAVMGKRLTGSFSDYRVGNYIALSLIPAFSMAMFLRPRLGTWAVPMTLACLAPAFFLMIFSYTRNVYITLACAFFLWIVLLRVFPWKFFLTAVLAFVASLPWLHTRFSWETLSQDGRWDLWGLAYEIFQDFPWFGAGIGQYNSAFRALGLSPLKDAVTISHPHNIYIQFLCENGIIGFVLAMTFLLGMLWWGFSKLRFLVPYTKDSSLFIHWRMTALYWCGWGAFLASGLVGHNFFQRWWLAMVMAYLGIMIGAMVHALRQVQEEKKVA